MKTIERGYLQIKTDEGTKWMHFSRTSLKLIEDLSGLGLGEFLGKVANPETSDNDRFEMLVDLVSAGLMAYDLEEDNDIEYNDHKVQNWVWEAAQEENFGDQIFEAFVSTLPIEKKLKGQAIKGAKSKAGTV